MSTKIYHNPRCSKSRQTLALLEEHQVQADVIEYLKTPPDAEELRQVLSLLQMEPRDLMRKKEAPYKELGLDNDALTDDQLIQAMCENPVLIERPIVINEKGAAIGRPPEQVISLL